MQIEQCPHCDCKTSDMCGHKTRAGVLVLTCCGCKNERFIDQRRGLEVAKTEENQMFIKRKIPRESYVLEMLEGKWVIVALDHEEAIGWKDLLWLSTALLYLGDGVVVSEYKSIVTAQIVANTLNEPYEKALIEKAFKPLPLEVDDE